MTAVRLVLALLVVYGVDIFTDETLDDVLPNTMLRKNVKELVMACNSIGEIDIEKEEENRAKIEKNQCEWEKRKKNILSSIDFRDKWRSELNECIYCFSRRYSLLVVDNRWGTAPTSINTLHRLFAPLLAECVLQSIREIFFSQRQHIKKHSFGHPSETSILKSLTSFTCDSRLSLLNSLDSLDSEENVQLPRISKNAVKPCKSRFETQCGILNESVFFYLVIS